jgi:hypothetical protein
MERLIESLGPAFIASFAIEQLLELLDPVLEVVAKPNKKWILSVISLGFALLVTLGLGLRLLAPFGYGQADWLDAVVTALFLTGGTKAINDLVKIIGYRKEAVKGSLRPEQQRNV